MDLDPAIIEAPYYDEVLIDGDVKAIGPLLTLYDGIVASLQEEYDREETQTRKGSERHHLVLYTRDSCPFCTKVTKYLNKENIPFTKKDVGKDRYAKELFQIGGKKQVPCLLINGKPMYESSDILNWLKSHIKH